MYKGDKVTVWNMRCSNEDKLRVARLAKKMRVKESEAVRVAIKELLARLTKRVKQEKI